MAGVAAALGASVPLWASLLCAGGALGVIGAEAMRQRQMQAAEAELEALARAEELSGACDAALLVLGGARRRRVGVGGRHRWLLGVRGGGPAPHAAARQAG